jgi:hypothetical protein
LVTSGTIFNQSPVDRIGGYFHCTRRVPGTRACRV